MSSKNNRALCRTENKRNLSGSALVSVLLIKDNLQARSQTEKQRGDSIFKGGLQMAPYNNEGRENIWDISNLQEAQAFAKGG